MASPRFRLFGKGKLGGMAGRPDETSERADAPGGKPHATLGRKCLPVNKFQLPHLPRPATSTLTQPRHWPATPGHPRLIHGVDTVLLRGTTWSSSEQYRLHKPHT